MIVFSNRIRKVCHEIDLLEKLYRWRLIPGHPGRYASIDTSSQARTWEGNREDPPAKVNDQRYQTKRFIWRQCQQALQLELSFVKGSIKQSGAELKYRLL